MKFSLFDSIWPTFYSGPSLKWSCEDISRAITEIQSGLSYRKVEAKYGIPKSSWGGKIGAVCSRNEPHWVWVYETTSPKHGASYYWKGWSSQSFYQQSARWKMVEVIKQATSNTFHKATWTSSTFSCSMLHTWSHPKLVSGVWAVSGGEWGEGLPFLDMERRWGRISTVP